jgi:hypothetical protein
VESQLFSQTQELAHFTVTASFREVIPRRKRAQLAGMNKKNAIKHASKYALVILNSYISMAILGT